MRWQPQPACTEVSRSPVGREWGACCLVLMVWANPAGVWGDDTALVEKLDSAAYTQRVEASRKCLESREAAIPELRKAAVGSNAEGSARALRTLEALMIADPPCESADRALLEIQDLGGPRGTRAGEILRGHQSFRSQCAKETLEKLGAKLLSERDEREIEMRRELGLDDPEGINGLTDAQANAEVPILTLKEPTSGPTRVSRVVLDERWKGGDEGLWHLRRLFDDRESLIFWKNGCPVSQDEVYQVASRLPHTLVEMGGRAFLGVSGLMGDGAIVENVVPGSVAASSGLQSNDQILKIDGVPLDSFQELLSEIGRRKAGDKVAMEISTNGQEKTLELTLGAREELPLGYRTLGFRAGVRRPVLNFRPLPARRFEFLPPEKK